MKKTLFSLAFVAASGVYVAGANHLFSPAEDGGPAIAANAAVPAEALPSMPPSVSTVPLVTSSQPSLPDIPAVTAEAAPAVPTATPTPPLPRRRPNPPAPIAVQPAASIDTAAAGSSGYRDGTYTGTDENAYYGRVQVQVTVTGHHVAGVAVLDYPQDRRTSRYINSQALPALKQEVIAAQSANIDIVSGATLTSEAYIKSLSNALGQAGGSNA